MKISPVPSLSRVSLFVVVALAATMLASLPAAYAALNGSKTTSVTLDVDGNTVGLSKSVTNNAGDTFSGGFGGTGTGDSNKGDLVTGFYPEQGGKLVRLLAHGGVQKITGGSCGSDGQYYQRARVTLLGVPNSAKVWAFYDPAVGSGSVVKTIPHFAENPDDDSGPDLANTRISATGNLPELCDGSTPYVVGGTPGTLNLGSGTDPNNLTTAGTYKTVGGSDTSIDFDVYVPMEGADGASTSIFLALGFVVDAGADGLDDDTDDVGITAWVSSRPWWLAADGKDEVHTLLSACASPSASADPCVESISGIFSADGSSSLASSYSVELESIMEAPSLEARLTLAPTAAIGSSGFSVPDGSIAKISVSWPTDGAFLGGPVNVGEGDNELDFSIASADTPIKVDPKNTSNSSVTNRWDIVSSGGRIVTTLIGEAKSTSSGISQDTWWPQCNVSISGGGAVTSEKCGADMTSNVSDGFMVFSSVPAEVNLMINSGAAPIAGGLVSTNGQGFAFGPETFSATAFQFAVSGPSFKADNSSRATDGFYYVCIPGTFLSGGFDTTSTAAATAWSGTRDGAAAAGTAFAVGNCGVGADGAGLVAELDPFGYSSPLFRLAPTPASGGKAASSGSSGSADAAAVAPVVAPQAAVARAATPEAVAKFSPENFVRSGAKTKNAAALVGGKIVDVVSEVTASGGARVGIGAVTLDLAVAEGNGSVSTEEGQPALAVKRGSDVALKGGGLQPDSTLQVFVPFANSSFAELPSITVDAEGNFSVDVSFTSVGRAKPFPIGLQSLQLSGVDEDGNATIIDIPITIAQSDAAPEINRLTGEQPALEPGQLIALVAGAPEKVEIDAAPGGAAIAGDGWSLELSGGVNQEANQPLTFAADQPARVSGDGFMGGTRADVFLFSTPTLLGSVTVADDGTFAADFDIDSALIEAGSHTLQIQGVGADGYVRAANLGVTVAPSELPSLVPAIDDGAGFNWWWLLWIAGMLVVVAGVTRALMQYRRTSLR